MVDSHRILQKTHNNTHQDYCFLSMRDGARGATYKHLIKNQVQLVAAGDS